MNDNAKTKAQLLAELEALRAQIVDMESVGTLSTRSGPLFRNAAHLSQALMEALPDLIFRLDALGTIVEFSSPPDTTDLYVPPEAFLGKSVRDVLPAAVADLCERSIAIARAKQESQTFEYSLSIAGHNQYFEQRLTAIDDGSVIAVIRNITERRQVEKALRASEEKYRLLFSASADAMVLVDAETLAILEANDAASRLYGYDIEMFRSLKAPQLSAEPNRSLVSIQNVLASPPGLPDLSRNRHMRQDGSTFFVDIAASNFVLDGRRTIFAVFRDVTPIVESTAELAESRKLFRQLAENIREVFWLLDWRSRKLLYISPAFETVWGRSVSDLYTDYAEWAAAIHPDDRAHSLDRFDRIAETGGGEASEYRIIRPNGEERWILDRGFAIYDDAGQIVRIAGLAEDITARKGQERDREALIAELEQKNAELEQFAYTVSHDLRSPLITIKGFVGHLAQDFASGDEKRFIADVARIEKAATVMGQLLNELLELSRIGRVINPTAQVSLADLAQEVVTQMERRLAEIEVQITIDPALPIVVADRLRMRVVFENLVENALKHLKARKEPRIEIGVRHEGQYNEDTVITVRDNGPGIDPLYHERIFRIFEKLDPTSEGTGIGLALVKRIIEVHNGRIWVESEGAGQGATFCFTIAGESLVSGRDGS